MGNEIKLGDNIFTVGLLNALDSFTLQPEIMPAVAEVLKVFTKLSGSVADLDLAELAPAVSLFFEKMDRSKLRTLTRELLGACLMDNTPLFTGNGDPFEIRMRGRTIDTWRLLWFAIQVNYPDFFGLLGARGSAREAAEPSAA